jgi:hypothetical protein
MVSRMTITGPTKTGTGITRDGWTIKVAQKAGFTGTRFEWGASGASPPLRSAILSLASPQTFNISVPKGANPKFWVRSFDTFGQNIFNELGTPPAIPGATSSKLHVTSLRPAGVCANDPNVLNWRTCISRRALAPTNTVFIAGVTHLGQQFTKGPIQAKPRGFMKPCGDEITFCLNEPPALTAFSATPVPHPNFWVVSFSPIGRNRVVEFGTPPPLRTAAPPPTTGAPQPVPLIASPTTLRAEPLRRSLPPPTTRVLRSPTDGNGRTIIRLRNTRR